MDTLAFTLTTQRLGALPLIGCFAGPDGPAPAAGYLGPG